jgi:hypothetical protein
MAGVQRMSNKRIRTSLDSSTGKSRCLAEPVGLLRLARIDSIITVANAASFGLGHPRAMLWQRSAPRASLMPPSDKFGIIRRRTYLGRLLVRRSAACSIFTPMPMVVLPMKL